MKYINLSLARVFNRIASITGDKLRSDAGGFEDTVQPTLDLAEALREPSLANVVVDVSGGTAWYVYLTVPADEKWTVYRASFNGGAQNNTCGNFAIYNAAGLGLEFLQTGTTVEEETHVCPLTLLPGWTYQYLVTKVGTGGATSGAFYYTREKYTA